MHRFTRPRSWACLALLGCAALHPCKAQAWPDPAPTRWPVGAQDAPVPDDSPAAVAEAQQRLRSAPRRPVCADASRISRPYGSTCASREFDAPPRLQAPRLQWSLEPGWRGLWSPTLVGDLLLTGSCFNDTHRGLSAIDTRNGQVRWRITAPCDTANRRGSVGHSSLHEWRPGQLLWALVREDGQPPDHLVVDLAKGALVGEQRPARPGAVRERDGVFLSITRSEKDQVTTLNAMGPTLDRLLWRLDAFRYKCDGLDRHCQPVFSASAGAAGVEYFSATAKDQADPPTRMLHAVDLRTGRVLWRHEEQPVTLQGPGPVKRRSDDGPPLLAAGKLVIRVDGVGGPVAHTASPGSLAFRALDPASGRTLWTSAPLPTRFTAAWGDANSQQWGTRLAAGDMLVTELVNGSGNARELWAYRLSDGSLAWRRPVPRNLRLMASAGGVLHVAVLDAGPGTHSLQGLDGQTGTLLWSTDIPSHNHAVAMGWPIEGPEAGAFLGPTFRIARDGAIYGTTVTTVYKMN